MSGVSFMEKLLNGVEVEWMPLADIAEIYGGLTGKSKADFDNGNATYISYKNIFNNIDVDPNQLEPVKVSDGERQHKVQYGDVLFTGSSEIADEVGMSSAITFDFKEPVYLNSFSFGVRFKDDVKLTPEFSKYLFRSKFMRAEIAKSASGVTRFNVSKARFKKILVPIPCPENPKKSLEIQAEIVRILDAFTAHTAELTAELTARKKQYHYYRDKLLSFEEGEVEWKTLGEVAEFRRGTAITKKQTTAGNIPVIANGPLPTYFHGEQNRVGETVVIARSGAYAGYVSYWNQPIFLTDAFSVHPDAKILTPKFIYHVLQNKQDHIHAMKKGAGVPHVRVKEFESYFVPTPSLSEQARIVAILDKFDALTNSITEGLPREIELRQKQYEYYRDLLLSFPRPDAEKTVSHA